MSSSFDNLMILAQVDANSVSLLASKSSSARLKPITCSSSQLSLAFKSRFIQSSVCANLLRKIKMLCEKKDLYCVEYVELILLRPFLGCGAAQAGTHPESEFGLLDHSDIILHASLDWTYVDRRTCSMCVPWSKACLFTRLCIFTTFARTRTLRCCKKWVCVCYQYMRMCLAARARSSRLSLPNLLVCIERNVCVITCVGAIIIEADMCKQCGYCCTY